jgi:glutamine synthetase
MVTGSTGSTDWAANLEVKCFDLLANPYLTLAALLAAGSAGMADGARLPDPIDVDPAALSEMALAQRGIRRLPTSLGEALYAFVADQALGKAFGQPLVDAIAAVRQSEIELFADATPEQVAAACRWAH